jgi:hypothetical protein
LLPQKPSDMLNANVLKVGAVRMFTSTQSEHFGHTVSWIEDSTAVRARFCGFELSIQKLAHDAEDLTGDGSVIRLNPRRYRTTVNQIIANPKTPIRGSLLQAKEDAVRFALDLPGRLEASRTEREKELLSKLGISSKTDA